MLAMPVLVCDTLYLCLFAEKSLVSFRNLDVSG